MHDAPHFVQRLAGGFPSLFRTFSDYTANQLGLTFEFLRTLADAANLLNDLLNDWLLAVQAADACGATAFLHPLAGGLIGIDLVQIPYRTFFRITRIGPPYARRVGLHGAQLLGHDIRVFAQTDGIAVGLGHLAA